MAGVLTKDDIQLLKSIFATKDDLKSELKKTEKRLIKRMDFISNSLDRNTMEVAKDVDRIKTRLGLSFA